MNPRDEIKDIAPKLSQWKEKEGYRMPSDYFDGLTDTVIDRVEENTELQPYFQALPDAVMVNIKNENKAQIVNLRPYYKYAVAAAMFLAVGSIVWSSMIEIASSPVYATTEATEEALGEKSADLDFVIEDLSLEYIFDSEFIDEDAFEEILVSEGEESEDFLEDVFYDADDELLQDFIIDAI